MIGDLSDERVLNIPVETMHGLAGLEFSKKYLVTDLPVCNNCGQSIPDTHGAVRRMSE